MKSRRQLYFTAIFVGKTTLGLKLDFKCMVITINSGVALKEDFIIPFFSLYYLSRNNLYSILMITGDL